jgi:hypothetical protein
MTPEINIDISNGVHRLQINFRFMIILKILLFIHDCLKDILIRSY